MGQKQFDRMENMLTDLIKIVGNVNMEIREVKQEVNKDIREVKQEVNKEFREVRQEVNKEIREVKQEVNKEIQEVKRVVKESNEVVIDELLQLNVKIDRVEKTVNSHTDILNSFKFDIDFLAEKQAKTELKVNRIEKILES
jgi:phenylalanyl-tRNA synthetase alpha subunit